jgi:hypothetical protein
MSEATEFITQNNAEVVFGRIIVRVAGQNEYAGDITPGGGLLLNELGLAIQEGIKSVDAVPGAEPVAKVTRKRGAKADAAPAAAPADTGVDNGDLGSQLDSALGQ